ncbi:MAG: P-II family nitrogen regulator [bacterium]|nr:P-II family nitrogen regulator [bacterium]
MKEIKAYIKTDRVEKVVQALNNAGAPGITVVEIHPVGYGFDANYFSRARETTRRYFEITKLEIVVKDEDVHQFVEMIRTEAHTGTKGDGMIFVMPVEMAVKIKTGAIGETGLH